MIKRTVAFLAALAMACTAHAQTTFHFWPSAMTPGIAIDPSGRAGAGGATAAGATTGIEKGFAGLLHFAITAVSPGLCQACRL